MVRADILKALNTVGGDRALLDELRVPAAARILIHLPPLEGTTAADLRFLGFSKSTTYRALRHLSDLGLIDSQETDRRTRPDEAGRPTTLWRLRA